MKEEKEMEAVFILVYMFIISLLTAAAAAVLMRHILLRECIVLRAEDGVRGEGGAAYGLQAVCAAAVEPMQETDMSEIFLRIRQEYSLTERETEILVELFEGRGNRMIASRLFISENTVKTHIHNLLQKMEVPSRAEALARVRAEMKENLF